MHLNTPQPSASGLSPSSTVCICFETTGTYGQHIFTCSRTLVKLNSDTFYPAYQYIYLHIYTQEETFGTAKLSHARVSKSARISKCRMHRSAIVVVMSPTARVPLSLETRNHPYAQNDSNTGASASVAWPFRARVCVRVWNQSYFGRLFSGQNRQDDIPHSQNQQRDSKNTTQKNPSLPSSSAAPALLFAWTTKPKIDYDNGNLVPMLRMCIWWIRRFDTVWGYGVVMFRFVEYTQHVDVYICIHMYMYLFACGLSYMCAYVRYENYTGACENAFTITQSCMKWDLGFSLLHDNRIHLIARWPMFNNRKRYYIFGFARCRMAHAVNPGL